MKPDWLQRAEKNGLEMTTQGVNLDVLAGSQGVKRLDALTETEAEFQSAVIAYAQLRGYRVAHFRKVRVQRKNGSVYWETPVAADGKGFLDLELVRDRLVKVELKVRPNTTTPEQEEWLAWYKRAGVEAHVFYPEDWSRIEEVLR